MSRVSFSFVVALVAMVGLAAVVAGQSHLPRPRARASVCGNPNITCKTSATFKPNELPFRVPKNSVIYDTELFYAVILKTIPVAEDNCNVFIPEAERLEAQRLFPDHKVFADRCYDIESLYYTNVDSKFRIMAVYGGTLIEAKRLLAAVKGTGKFSGAYLRRMRASFNGT
jgi:hypothetical protein